jgi:hypothetical protein
VNADEAAALMIDLAYGLAIARGGTKPQGVYVHSTPTGASIGVDDESGGATYFLTAAECRRLGRYLLACGQAAES